MSNKQHPVDKLFAQKLEGLESIPSGEAWSRLESRLQQKKGHKKGVVWFAYAAAAAIVLLVGAVWVVTIREVRPITSGIVATTTPSEPKAADTRSARPVETPGEVAKNTSTSSEQIEGSAIKDELSPAPVIQTMPSKQVAKKGAIRKKKQPIDKIESQEQPVVAHEFPTPTPIPDEQLAHKKEEALVAPVAQALKAEEQTLVVVVQLPEDTRNDSDAEETTTPRTRTGRILEGLKKVKQGEFRELGIKPDQLLARFREKTDTK